MGRHAFISVDAEGMPYIVGRPHMGPGDKLFHELREVMSRVTYTVAEELRAQGFDRVVVADSHGSMLNIDPFKAPRGVEIVRGFPRPLSMVAGAGGAEAAYLLGYHTSPQGGGVLGHTYAGRIIQRVLLDGAPASEYLLNTYALGELGVPVVMVAGDKALEPEVSRHTPWAVFVPLKEPLSYFAAVSRSMEEVVEELRSGVAESLARLRRGEAKPLEPPEGMEFVVEFKRPFHADLASLFPCVERLDPITVKLTCGGFVDKYKMFEGLVMAAYAMESR